MTQPKPRSELGERIRAAAEAIGISQTKLESAVASRGYLSRVINGERGAKSVDPRLLEKIADICQVNYHWLAIGRGPMHREDFDPAAGRIIAAKAIHAVELEAREVAHRACQIARSLGASDRAIESVLYDARGENHPEEWWVDAFMAATTEILNARAAKKIAT